MPQVYTLKDIEGKDPKLKCTVDTRGVIHLYKKNPDNPNKYMKAKHDEVEMNKEDALKVCKISQEAINKFSATNFQTLYKDFDVNKFDVFRKKVGTDANLSNLKLMLKLEQAKRHNEKVLKELMNIYGIELEPEVVSHRSLIEENPEQVIDIANQVQNIMNENEQLDKEINSLNIQIISASNSEILDDILENQYQKLTNADTMFKYKTRNNLFKKLSPFFDNNELEDHDVFDKKTYEDILNSTIKCTTPEVTNVFKNVVFNLNEEGNDVDEESPIIKSSELKMLKHIIEQINATSGK